MHHDTPGRIDPATPNHSLHYAATILDEVAAERGTLTPAGAAELAAACRQAADHLDTTTAAHEHTKTTLTKAQARLARLRDAHHEARRWRNEAEQLRQEMTATAVVLRSSARPLFVVRWSPPDWSPTTSVKSRTFWTRDAAERHEAKRRAQGYTVTVSTFRAVEVEPGQPIGFEARRLSSVVRRSMERTA